MRFTPQGQFERRFAGVTWAGFAVLILLALCSFGVVVAAPGAGGAGDGGAADAPPVEEKRAGGEEKMRYFLMGPTGDAAPAGGYRLLLVLPGGDGSDEFRPFVANVLSRALPDGYVVAQLVAPVWREDEDRAVWPTEKVPDAKMAFPTEKFIDAVVAEVRGAHKIDPEHVYALGWSSGGPPIYAAAMRRETPLTGAFVAMSVFMPAELPEAKGLEGRSFYLLHSPEDFIPIRFAESARDTLAEGGASTTLVKYAGGHGWRGDVPGMIAAGVKWLEERAAAGAEAEREQP